MDDDEFIHLLTQSKAQVDIMNSNHQEWLNKMTVIKKFLDNYRDMAERASSIYMSLQRMNRLNPLLSWNVNLFTTYFKKACV